jgi:hypothetical protein
MTHEDSGEQNKSDTQRNTKYSDLAKEDACSNYYTVKNDGMSNRIIPEQFIKPFHSESINRLNNNYFPILQMYFSVLTITDFPIKAGVPHIPESIWKEDTMSSSRPVRIAVTSPLTEKNHTRLSAITGEALWSDLSR